MKLFVALLVALAVLFQSVQSTIIGIDLASDSLKVALIRPGHPLEIVTNFQSKRKTPTSIAFFKGERSFGSDATALSGRKPESSISKLQRMVGHGADHPLVQEILHKQYYPYQVSTNDTTGLMQIDVLDGGESSRYTAEELLAMVLEHVKDFTQAFGEENNTAVKDCVIAVPASFTQHERNAVFTAAEIAKLNVLGLIEENTAAALHYGMDHVFEQPRNVLYFNLGAGSLEVSVVHYSSYNAKEGGKERKVGQFEVLGKAFDESVGGFAFDIALTELFADKFNAVWKQKKGAKAGDVKQFAKPMVRLKNEASKVKQILSANQEFPIRIEALHADVDLSLKVTRKDFETAAEHLFSRLTGPIESALRQANLTVNELYGVELLGGGVRMPRVKTLLEEFFAPAAVAEKEGGPKKSIVGQHMNGDEAMALGAAFHAANLSTSFKVRKVGMLDTQLFAVQLQLEDLPRAEPAQGRFGSLFGSSEKEKDVQVKFEKTASLFGAKSTVPSKVKTVAFTHDEDIVCRLLYNETASAVSLPPGTPSLLAEYNITGIAAFSKETRAQGAEATPKVLLSFHLDRSGVATLVKAEISVELPQKKEEEETEEKKEKEGGTEEKTSDAENKTAENVEEKEQEKKTEENASSASAESEEKKSESAKKPASVKKDNKPKELRRALSISSHKGAGVAHWTPALVAEAQARLRALYLVDEARRARAKAMNDLEAALYKIKNRIADDEDALSAVSTAEQRESVVAAANEVEDWLYDEGREQPLSVYAAKQSALVAQAEEIFSRHREVSLRAQAVDAAEKVLSDIASAVDAWEFEQTMPQVSTEERDALREMVRETRAWIEERVAAQRAHSATARPLWESKDVRVKVKKVEGEFKRLLKKPHPIVHAVKHNETETESEPVKVEVNQDAPKESETEKETETEGETAEKTQAESEEKEQQKKENGEL